MVHPYMRQSKHALATESAQVIARPIIEMLSRLHVLVIGPGLGRDPLMHDTCALIMQAAREKGMPFVLDADGLGLAQTRPELVHGYRECVLTPNVVEFARLCKSQGIDGEGEGPEKMENLCRALGGVTIIQKGGADYISNGEQTWTCDLKGGLKRSGGQGDTLTGSLATFLAWRKAYRDRLWEHSNDLAEDELLALAAFGGCAVTRVSTAKTSWAEQQADYSRNVHDWHSRKRVAVFRLVILRMKSQLLSQTSLKTSIWKHKNPEMCYITSLGMSLYQLTYPPW